MRLNEILNSKGNPKLWSKLPCEICDAPTVWILSPYCAKCEWLIAYWRGGVVDHESSFGDMPSEYVLDGDTGLAMPELRRFFNDRGYFVDPLYPTKVRRWGCGWSDNIPRVNLTGDSDGHWSTVAVRDFDWRHNEQNQPERISKLERSINEKD